MVARHGERPWISFDGGSSFAASTADAVSWNSFSMSLDGTTIVGGAGGNYIHISRDSGSSWSVVDPAGGPMGWTSVSCSEDCSVIAAVAGGGNIWTSTDAGTTWTEDSSVGSSKDWQSIAVSGDASKIVAVALNANIWLSTDRGATFVEQAVGTNEEWTDVAVSCRISRRKQDDRICSQRWQALEEHRQRQ